MPYTYKKQGDKYVVYKKSNGKKVGSTAGTKTALNKYLAALHIHEPKKESKKAIKENMEYENKVGQLYVVQKPSAGCDMAGMVYEVDPITGIQPHGVDAQTVHGVYASMEEAQKVAEKLYDGHMTGMKKLEEKKGKVTEKLTKTITMLEKKQKSMMEMAKANPKEASMHKGKISEIQAKIQELMDKLEMVEKSKTPIEEKEEDKKSLKENIGERKWKIGDKFTAKASDVVYTISKVSEKTPNEVIITYTDRKGKNHVSPTWISHVDHFFNKGAWELVEEKNMQENIGERKWKIGDQFTPRASDVVHTIDRFDEKNPGKVIITYTDRKGNKYESSTEIEHLNYFINKGAWELIGKKNMQENTEESFEDTLKNFIKKKFPNENIKVESPGKKSAVIVYNGGEEMDGKYEKTFETEFNIYPHAPEGSGKQTWYYTIEKKLNNQF